MILVVICPQALIGDGNHLGNVFADGIGEAFGTPIYQDADGNLYSIACVVVTDGFMTGIQQALVRPSWDTENAIDMTAATRAQGNIRFTLDDIKTKLTARYVDTFDKVQLFIDEAELALIPEAA